MAENDILYINKRHGFTIEDMAAEIMKTGVKFKDACHVASAIYSQCGCFISTDIRLLKYRTNEIKMLTPIEFLAEMEEG